MTYFSSVKTFHSYCVYCTCFLHSVSCLLLAGIVAFILPGLDCFCVTAETGEILVATRILYTVYPQYNVELFCSTRRNLP